MKRILGKNRNEQTNNQVLIQYLVPKISIDHFRQQNSRRKEKRPLPIPNFIHEGPVKDPDKDITKLGHSLI